MEEIFLVISYVTWLNDVGVFDDNFLNILVLNLVFLE